MKSLNAILFSALAVLLWNYTGAQTDVPCGAPALTIGSNCTFTNGTTAGATQQTNAANGNTPSCGSIGPDVWYTFTAPPGGAVNIVTEEGTITNGDMALYSGPCTSPTQISCDNNSGNGNMPAISATGLTPGTVYYIRFWRNGGGTGTFQICVTTPPTNAVCAAQTPICSGSPINFIAGNSGVNASVANPGNNYGCLSTSPNPSWYYLKIATAGNLVVDITAGADVDFAIWGPFASLATAAAACNTYGAPADCSYSTAAVEQVNVSGTTVGQVYVLLVTNYANVVQTITVTNGGGTATTDCSIVPLPVGFAGWYGDFSNGEAHLNWITQSEQQSDYFTVQRSTDGTIWESIAFVDAAGNSSSIKTYAYTDRKPKDGVNYYRLKQVDENGLSIYTNLIAVENRIETELDAYPNPTTGLVVVTEKEFEVKEIYLTDLSGRKSKMTFTRGGTSLSLDLKDFVKGIYTLEAIDVLGNVRTTKLIKD